LFALRDRIRFFSDRNVLELVGVLEGVKTVVRIPVTSSEWQLLREGCERFGLIVGHANFKLAVVRTTRVGDTFTTNVQWDDPRGREFLAYVANSREAVQLALETEVTSGSDSSMGQLYQYPECCIQAYAEIVQGLPWVDALVSRANSSWQRRGANKLAYLFDGASLFPDYFPCSLSCASTAELSQLYRSLLIEYGMADFANSLWERMARPILVGEGIAYQFADARLEAGGLRFDPTSMRRYSWRDDEPACLSNHNFLPIQVDGPWLRASAAGRPLGTLFLFDKKLDAARTADAGVTEELPSGRRDHQRIARSR
jgi:hypothetical protein